MLEGNISMIAMTESEKQTIKQFAEAVNDLACENMLKPPYKLEGQHKRAIVILCKEYGIDINFGDEQS